MNDYVKRTRNSSRVDVDLLAQLTDAGLVHLKGLTKLEWLYLNNTQVANAGLVHLKGLTKPECSECGEVI